MIPPRSSLDKVDTVVFENLCKANTPFALDLFKSLGDKNKTANMFFSPMSISSALSMVLLGARGDTANQMTECLKLKDCKDVHSSFGTLLQELNKPNWSNSTLCVANKLYGESSNKFVKEFLEGTRKFYDSEVEAVDFFNKAEKARNQINCWVEEKTQGKIKNLLAKDAVNSFTKLVLVNAVYFKAHWQKTFHEGLTHDATFRVNKYETQTVKMMMQSGPFSLRQVDEVGCQVINLRYKGMISMFIFLPNDIEDSTTGLEKLEQQLTYETFMEWTRPDKMASHMVELKLPRFRIEENYGLSEVLQNMGIRDAFDESKCDFSGMSPTKDLMLSKAVHKTFVDVDEVGTEAAAAALFDLVIGSACCNDLPQASFIADHPFLFFIQHYTTRAVLFAGRFCTGK